MPLAPARLVPLALLLAPAALAQNQGLVLDNSKRAEVDVRYDRTVVPRTGVTVEAWVTYDSTTLPAGSRWPTVLRQNPLPGQESIMLRVQASSTQNRVLRWYVRTNGRSAGVNWSFTLGALKTWTHVAGTYDGTTARLLINGRVVGSATGNGTIVDRGQVLRIGNGDVSRNAETWNGQIDELRLWPFARTAAEIGSTMRLELQRVPGEVSTWNFNGNGNDSSGRNHGTATQNARFAANTLKLTRVPFLGALSYGKATAGCAGTPVTGGSAWPGIGSRDFAILGLNGTRTGAGAVYLALNRVNSPLRALGAEVWVDLRAGLFVPTAPHPLGATRVPLAIPNNPWLVGKSIYAQFFWREAGCATPLIASDGLGMTFLR